MRVLQADIEGYKVKAESTTEGVWQIIISYPPARAVDLDPTIHAGEVETPCPLQWVRGYLEAFDKLAPLAGYEEC